MSLRPYQVQAVKSFFENCKTHRSQLMVMATGMGKTRTFCELAKGIQGDVLILARRVEIVEQNADAYTALTGVTCWIEQGHHRVPPMSLLYRKRVISASVDSLSDARLASDIFSPHRFGLVIVDEAHGSPTKSIMNILCHFGIMTAIPSNSSVGEAKVGKTAYYATPFDGSGVLCLGVTATPHRADGRCLRPIFSHCCMEYPMRQAIKDGWLVNPTQEVVKVNGLDLRPIEPKGDGDFNDSELEQLFIEEGPLHEVASVALQRANGRSGFIYASGVTHAHNLAVILNRHRKDSAVAVDGKTDKELRRKYVNDFRAGKIQWLVNFGVFAEGFDAPQASVIVMARPTRSLTLKEQIYGRVLRPLVNLNDAADADERRRLIAESAKPNALILDCVGVANRRLPNLVDVLGQKLSFELVDLAHELVESGVEPEDALKQAELEAVKLLKQSSRRNFKPTAIFETREESIFLQKFNREIAEQAKRSAQGGSSTREQVNFLMDFGITRETAAGYTRKQASAVLDCCMKTRTTLSQRRQLEYFGYNPDEYNYASAKEVLALLRVKRG